MITLGSNIHLHGFETLDYADNLIAKKLIGSYIRKISDRYEDCEYVNLTLKPQEKGFDISVEVKTPTMTNTASASGANLFMTIDDALKSMLKELEVPIE